MNGKASPWHVESVDRQLVERLAASGIGNYLAKIIAWDFEASDDDPMVVLDLVPLTPHAVEPALARARAPV